VENSLNTPDKGSSEQLKLFLDPSILSDFENLDLQGFTKVTEDGQLSLFKQQDRLWIVYPNGEHCDFPYYLKNIQNVLNTFRNPLKKSENSSGYFESFLKTAMNIERKAFSSVSLSPGENVKDLWDEIIKKINLISNESHSLRSLMEKLLDVRFLQKFESS